MIARGILVAGLALAGVVLLSASAVGLEGKDNYTATALFSASDVESLSAWSGIDVRFGWGAAPTSVLQEEMTVDSNGAVYVYAWGDDSDGDWFNGVVRYDPDSEAVDSIILEEFFFLDPATQTEWYGNIDCITASPTTAGELTEDHLVLVRNLYDADLETYSLQVSTLDPDSPSGESVLFTTTGGGPDSTEIAIDPTNGDIFLSEIGWGNGSNPGTIRRFRWTGSSYSEFVVTTAGTARWGLLAGPGGYIYSFDGSTTLPEKIIRIDPDFEDSYTQYAILESSTDGSSRFRGWSFDSAGKFWIGMRDVATKKGRRGPYAFVTEVTSGGTVRFGDRIAEANKDEFLAFTAGPSEKIYVTDDAHTVWELVMGSGGGGNGNGKGKNK